MDVATSATARPESGRATVSTRGRHHAVQGFVIDPLPPEVAAHVRRTRTDPVYGYDYNVRVDETPGSVGHAPCVSCLRRFRRGEPRLLFLYNPFTCEVGDYAGPVFLHERPCTPFAGEALPSDLLDLPLLLQAYDAAGAFIGERRPRPESVEADLRGLGSDPRVAVVHARSDEAGFFIARVLPSATDE